MNEEEKEIVNVGTPGHEDHDTSTPGITMKDMVLYEVKRLASLSKLYQKNISEAKTQTKKKFYHKKLRKNNKELADMIMRLEHLNKMGDTSE